MAERLSSADLERMGLQWSEKEQAYIKVVGALRRKTISPESFFKGNSAEELGSRVQSMGGIFIPGNVPSSKNNRGLMRVAKVVKQTPMMVSGSLMPSQLVTKYKQETKRYWEAYRSEFIKMLADKQPPYTISFFFIRGRNNSWDYANIVQIPQDLMQEYEWISNDDAKTMIPDFSEGFAIDYKRPGVIIKVK